MVGKKRVFIKKEKPKEELATKKYVKKIVKNMSETKFHNYSPAGGSVVGTVNPQAVTTILQGTQDDQRIGDEITLKTINLRYHIEASINAVSNDNVRVLMIQWFDTTAPTSTQILANPATGPGVVSYYYYDSFRRGNRMKVLYDKTHSISETQGGTSGVNVNKWIKPYKFTKHLSFSAAGNDPIHGGIYIIFVSDDATANSPTATFFIHLEFMDL